VNAARPGEACDVEAIAPAVGGLRPLRRSATVAERLAGIDRDAVDDSSGERIELPARRGRRRFVENREPARHVAGPDSNCAVEDERRRLEAPVAEARRELARPIESFPRTFELAHVDRVDRACQGEMPVLDPFGLVGEQAFSTGDPTARHRHRSAEPVVHREHHREHGGPPGLTRAYVRGVGPLAQRDRLLEAAGPPRGVGEVLEVFRGKSAVLVRAPEELVSVAPGMLPRGFPAGFERVVDDLSHRLRRFYVGVITARAPRTRTSPRSTQRSADVSSRWRGRACPGCAWPGTPGGRRPPVRARSSSGCGRGGSRRRGARRGVAGSRVSVGPSG
jgi:hypothetical protein